MVDILIKISGAESTVFMAGIAVFYLLAALEWKQTLEKGADVYCRNLFLCRTWSLVTALMAWAAALFGTREEYLAACQTIGTHCGRAGEYLMAAALVFLVAHAVLALANRGTLYRDRMKKMTVSSMSCGLIFSLMEVLLIGG